MDSCEGGAVAREKQEAVDMAKNLHFFWMFKVFLLFLCVFSVQADDSCKIHFIEPKPSNSSNRLSVKNLLALAKSRNEQERKSAVRQAGELKSKKSLDVLNFLKDDPDVSVRKEVLISSAYRSENGGLRVLTFFKEDSSVYLRFLAEKLLKIRTIIISEFSDKEVIQNTFKEATEDISSIEWLEPFAVLREKNKNSSASENVEIFNAVGDSMEIARGILGGMMHENPFVRLSSIYFFYSLVKRAEKDAAEIHFLTRSFLLNFFIEEQNPHVSLAFLDVFKKMGVEDPYILSIILEKGMKDPNKDVQNAAKLMGKKDSKKSRESHLSLVK